MSELKPTRNLAPSSEGLTWKGGVERGTVGHGRDGAAAAGALRDRLAVVIANTELARLMAESSWTDERLARVLAAAWEADALLAELAEALVA